MTRYRTPLRYPGGKKRLAGFLEELIVENDLSGGEYVEVFAGGAGIAWELLANGIVSFVRLNDSALPIYLFWKACLFETDEFCRRIRSVPLTVEEWKRQRHVLLNPGSYDEIDVGFGAFYLNRCNRSGVLSGGLIGGLGQDGAWKMDARFSRAELIKRVEALGVFRESVVLTQLDAAEFIRSVGAALGGQALVYLDPPYYSKSRRLYLDHYTPSDHQQLADLIQQKIQVPWVVSYDAVSEIEKMYCERRCFRYKLHYSASGPKDAEELFIFSDNLAVPDGGRLRLVAVA